jgi:HEAT repeat protein
VGLEAERPAAVRQVAAELLGRLGAIDATDELIAMLGEDPDVETRVAAAGALGRIGLPRAVAPLIASLTVDPSLAVREAAATALGALGGEAGVTALEDALCSGEYRLARSAAEALSTCGTVALARLEAVASGEGPGAAEARDALDRVALAAYARGRLAA